MKKLILAAMFFLSFALSASAANFVEINRNSKVIVSIDLDSIQDKGTYCLACIKYIPRGEYAKETSKQYRSEINYILGLNAYDKSEKQVQTLQGTAYLKNGRVESAKNPFNQYNYEYVVPGTIDELVYDTVMYVISNRK